MKRLHYTLTIMFIILIVGILLYVAVRNYTKYKLINWAGNVSDEFNEMYYPANEHELTSIMKDLKPKTPIIISGGNHSWNPTKFYLGTNTNKSASSTRICLNLVNLKGDISYDDNSSIVT